MSGHKRLIVALDYQQAEAALRLLDELDPKACRVKIGKQLFTACGPALVRQAINAGFEVFLDLKFHDIPNTVAGAVRAAAELGVWMLNLHAAGGPAMMEQAARALDELGDERPLLIAVTVLTSLDRQDLARVGIDADPQEQVVRLARLSQQAGLDGVVCSAAETRRLRAGLGDDFCLVTPGIRRPGDFQGDQKRVADPARAIANGSTYLVVGRPITRAAAPNQALREFNAAINGIP